MKRALVAYSSDSETEPPPAKRKKALPQLSTNLTVPAPVDDPSRHQGRKRSQPYVEGQFAGYVYVPVTLDGALKVLLSEVMKDLQSQVPGIHLLFDSEVAVNGEAEGSRKDMGIHADEQELHLSLSRPIYLREHQRETARTHVKQLASTMESFKFSLTSFTTLINDERTRSFLALEVGAGHVELGTLSAGLNPLLTELRQPLYYSSARYHVSFAWTLMADAPSLRTESGDVGFSESLAKRLDDKYGVRLREIIFDVDKVHLKIGKHVHKFRLT